MSLTPKQVRDVSSFIVQESLKLYDSLGLYEILIRHIVEQHQNELSFISDPKAKENIVAQRLPYALEELGFIQDVILSLDALGISDELNKINEQKNKFKLDYSELNDSIVNLAEELDNLQIKVLGRVEVRTHNEALKNLQEKEKDLEIVELDAEPSSTNFSKLKGLRSVQPNELLLGIQGSPGQPVFFRNFDGLWQHGKIAQLSTQDDVDIPLTSININQHVNTGGDPLDLNRAQPTGQLEHQVRYLIEFDAAGDQVQCRQNLVDASKIALTLSADRLKQKYPAGSRVVCRFQSCGYFAGLIAEPPHDRNSHRYLIFFEDGYPYYAGTDEVYRIFGQSKNNWRETDPAHQVFIKRYLAQYPQRPMVRLKLNQTIKTELNGAFVPATVEKVDASLAFMRFSETHSEWMYRGSPRFEPLFSETVSSANPTAKDQNVMVDYSNIETSLNCDSGPSGARPKVRKSATGARASMPALVTSDVQALNRTAKQPINLPPNLDNLANHNKDEDYQQRQTSKARQESAEAGRVVKYLNEFIKTLTIKPFVNHKCTLRCRFPPKNTDEASASDPSDSPFDYRGLNPLEIPLRVGWLRSFVDAIPTAAGRSLINYIAPCGRRIRSAFELEHFLHNTDSQLTSDLFCFDTKIEINQEFRCEKAFTRIADISYGKENVPVPCVNSVDNEAPSFIDYITQRQPVGNVAIPSDPDFLVCCDCTDNCRDRSKCACQQLTIEASAFSSSKGLVDFTIGYRHRRLSQFTMGGIYECNSRCKCDRRCYNRVVQHGLSVRLQVFKTIKKGWGIRALNAIPKGTFICTYAGAIYDDNMAIDEGYDFGDEYQAELDYIETIEKPKEGFEPFAIEPSDSADEYDFSLPSNNQNNMKREHRRRILSISSNSSSSSSLESVASSAPTITSGKPLPTEPDLTKSVDLDCDITSNPPLQRFEMSRLDLDSEKMAQSISVPDSEATNCVAPKPQETIMLNSVTAGDMSNIVRKSDGIFATECIDLCDSPDCTVFDCVTIQTASSCKIGNLSHLSSPYNQTQQSPTKSADTSDSIKYVTSEPVFIIASSSKTDQAPPALEYNQSRVNIDRVPTDFQTSLDNKGAIFGIVAGEDSHSETEGLEVSSSQTFNGYSALSSPERPRANEISDDPSSSLVDLGGVVNAPEIASGTEESQTVQRQSITTFAKASWLAINDSVPLDILQKVGISPSQLMLPGFISAAPGLSDCTGIRNLTDILQRVSFNRLPFVKLTPIDAPMPSTQTFAPKQRSSRESLMKRQKVSTQTQNQFLLSRSGIGGKSRPMAVAASSGSSLSIDPTQPRMLLRLSLCKTASGALSRSSSSSSITSMGSQATAKSKRSSSTSDLQRKSSGKTVGLRRSTAQRERGANDRGYRGSRSPTVSVTSSCLGSSVGVAWVGRRTYPIAQRGWRQARAYFGNDETPYVMDAKKMGNLGRYFNHSCNPNVFVQNVFIETHDPRFPEVAFFAKRNIEAGEEMTWDYGYVVDAVPLKVLYCYCEETDCRIRLL